MVWGRTHFRIQRQATGHPLAAGRMDREAETAGWETAVAVAQQSRTRNLWSGSAILDTQHCPAQSSLSRQRCTVVGRCSLKEAGSLEK